MKFTDKKSKNFFNIGIKEIVGNDDEVKREPSNDAPFKSDVRPQEERNLFDKNAKSTDYIEPIYKSPITGLDGMPLESMKKEVKREPSNDAPFKSDVRPQEERNLFDKYTREKSDSVGWVQKGEVKKVREHIKKCLGFDPPRMCGDQMAVAVYEETVARDENGKKTNIILSETSIKEDKFRKAVGMVVEQGSECYMRSRFREHWIIRFLRIFFNFMMPKQTKKPWCRVGDWVMFDRHKSRCTLVNYRGYPMFMMYDDNVYSVIEDPSYITRDFV